MVARDRFHAKVRDFIENCLADRVPLFSSSFALGETLGLLQTRHGVRAARRFMTDVFPAIDWRWVDPDLYARVWRIADQRGARGFTVVDASAVACVEERPGSSCLAVDDDLRGFGFEVHP